MSSSWGLGRDTVCLIFTFLFLFLRCPYYLRAYYRLSYMLSSYLWQICQDSVVIGKQMSSTTKVNPVLTYGMPVREVDSGATFISGFQIILNFSDYLALMNFHPPLPLLSTSTTRGFYRASWAEGSSLMACTLLPCLQPSSYGSLAQIMTPSKNKNVLAKSINFASCSTLINPSKKWLVPDVFGLSSSLTNCTGSLKIVLVNFKGMLSKHTSTKWGKEAKYCHDNKLTWDKRGNLKVVLEMIMVPVLSSLFQPLLIQVVMQCSSPLKIVEIGSISFTL